MDQKQPSPGDQAEEQTTSDDPREQASEMEQAQKDAAEERETERGYQ